MAVFKFFSPVENLGLSLNAVISVDYGAPVRVDLSASHYVLTGRTGKMNFSGSDLSYQFGGTIPVDVPLPVGGTIDGLTIKLLSTPTPLMTITGLASDATELADALIADPASFANYLLRGNDQITMTPFNDTMDGGKGNDVIHGKGGDDYLLGGGGNDQLFGEGGSNSLFGESGKDTIFGGASYDSIMGGAGNDVIYGGAGENSIYGDGGKDQFVFNAALASGNKSNIYEFQQGLDKIVLDNDVFKALSGSGPLTAAQFHVGIAAADASDRIIYNAATHQMFYDRDGTGAAAAVEIGTVYLTEPVNLKASDFLILT